MEKFKDLCFLENVCGKNLVHDMCLSTVWVEGHYSRMLGELSGRGIGM